MSWPLWGFDITKQDKRGSRALSFYIRKLSERRGENRVFRRSNLLSYRVLLQVGFAPTTSCLQGDNQFSVGSDNLLKVSNSTNIVSQIAFTLLLYQTELSPTQDRRIGFEPMT